MRRDIEPADLLAGGSETSLEFSDVLERVATYAAGPLGRARVLSRRPLRDPGAVREELARVAEAMTLLEEQDAPDIPPVEDLAPVLARLRIEGSVLDMAEVARIRAGVAAAREVNLGLRSVAERAPRVAALASPPLPPLILKRLDQVLDEAGEIRDDASAGLLAARRGVGRARELLLARLDSVLRGLGPTATVPNAAITIREGRYVIPVRRDSRSRPPGVVHDESATHGTLFIEPSAVIPLGNALRAAIADEARELLIVLREVSEMLRPQGQGIAEALEMCVRADDLFARARHAHGAGATVPLLGETNGPCIIRQGRHPLLLDEGRPVVPFDLVLDPSEHTLVISGPNTGGKTVLIKAIGLTVLMHQSGLVPVVGPGSVIPLCGAVFADIGDHQSIAANLSTFSAHLATMRRILEEAGPDSLVLVDEIGSGTDPVEGAALAAAMLSELTCRGVRTVATTHLGALKTLATDLPGVVNGSLEFDTETLSPTWHFRKGLPGRSYGIAIARRLGLSSAVLADAEARVPVTERALEELLTRVEAREQGLEEARKRLEEDREWAESVARDQAGREAALRRRESEVEDRERTLIREGKEKARRFLLEARGTVEEALELARGGVDDARAREARRRVEDAIQGGSDPDSAVVTIPPEPEDQGGPILVGTRVRMSRGGVGEVLEIRRDGRLVIRAGALKVVLSTAEVVRLPGREPVRVAATPSVFEVPDAASEIDLRGMRGDEAESATRKALDAAVLADLPALRIIHGMGTGVVRECVHRVLAADPRVGHYAFAPPAQGGTGVTIADVRG